MKTLFLSLLISMPVWAFSSQLEEINKPADELLCATETDDELLTPVDALKEINTGKLTFMGRQMFPGSGQNYTCVYRSDTAFILYNNCMASKKESSALDIEVIAFNGDIASFYIQNATSDVPVSATVRSDYSMSWRVSSTSSPAVSNKMTVADLIKHKQKYSEISGGCSIGSTFKAQDLSTKPFCLGGVNNPAWKEAAQEFWVKPTDEWYKTQKYLRTVVESTKF